MQYSITYREQVALVALKLLVENRSWAHVGDSDEIVRQWVVGSYQVADAFIEEGKKGKNNAP